MNNRVETHAKSGRSSRKPKSGLKKEHSLVLAALESVNVKLDRPCLIREIIAELKEKDKAILNKTYSKSLSSSVSTILILLGARGLIETVRSATKQRFFGSKRILEEFKLPEIHSRRRKVFFLVEKAVTHHKRAVRIEEVLRFAEQVPELLDVSPIKITTDIIGLAQSGELNRVNYETFGFRGNSFYLPAHLSEPKYLPSDASNWLEKTYKCFQIAWKKKVEESSLLQEKISPLTTAEVRREFFEQYPEAAHTVSVRRFTNMLLYLSSSSTPKVRKMNNPRYNSSAWLPVNVKDSEVIPIAQFYSSDAERVEEATRRAEGLLSMPVNVVEIKTQVNKDVRLKLKSKSSLAFVLSASAKPMSNGKPNGKVQRKIKHVGNVDGRSYYTAGEVNFEEARRIVAFWKLRSRFEKLKCDEELKLINASSLPYLQYGRLYLMRVEIQEIKSELNKLNLENKTSSVFTEIEEMDEILGFKLTEIDIFKTKYEVLVDKKYDLKQLTKGLKTNAHIGLIASRVLEVVRPFYRPARRLKKDNQLVPFLHDVIKRFPNPDFTYRFSTIPEQSSEYLFDRTDLLLYTASKWGNRFSYLQAQIARRELGAIRNPDYIYPLLKNEDFTIRLKAVSCLGFLHGEDVPAVLEEISHTDKERNVRRVAEWSKTVASNNIEEIIQLFKAHSFSENYE